jgi:hypothetical protein
VVFNLYKSVIRLKSSPFKRSGLSMIFFRKKLFVSFPELKNAIGEDILGHWATLCGFGRIDRRNDKKIIWNIVLSPKGMT